MSRRREEAELQRVLQLSTQQTRALGALPPYSLSSAPSDDSRDMELRPVYLSTSGTAQSTPRHPPHGRFSHFLSPDLEDGDYSPPPPLSHVDHIVPIRSTRESPDPIDSFEELLAYRDIHHSSPRHIPLPQPPELEIADGASGPIPSSPPSGASANANAAASVHVSSSGTEGSRRQSARQQIIQDKKEADAAERKRKRAERKARAAAAKAESDLATGSGDPAFEPARPPPQRRTKRAKVDKSAADSAAPAASRQPGLEESTPLHISSNANIAVEAPHASAGSSASSGKASTPTALTFAEACGNPIEPHLEGANTTASDVGGAVKPSLVQPEVTAERSSPNEEDPCVSKRSVNSPHPATVATPTAPSRVLRPAQTTPKPSSTTPSGGQWRTPRNDLAGVLAKFPGARRTGMSRRLNIVPLHASIGQGVKALPPPPPKNKKKVEEEDDDDDEDENGNPKIKVGSREWLMLED